VIARIMDFLRGHHPFVLLTEVELDRVCAAAEAETIPAGRRILEQGGDISRCLFLLADGRVELVRDGVTIQTLEEGDCFGYPSIISGNPPTSNVVAETEVAVHCVPDDVFTELLSNAQFAEFFLRSLSDRLSRISRSGSASLGGELTTEIGALGLRSVVRIASTSTVAEAARAMRAAREDVVIVDGDEPGIVTDHDFQVKVLAEGLGPDTPVDQVVTRPLKTLPTDTPVHSALLVMLEERIHHLPVTVDDRIEGIVSATDLLRHQTRNPLYLMRQLENLDSAAPLATYARDAAAMVERLFDGGLKVAQIGRVFASINDTMVRRLLRLAEQELGPPPTPYAWLVYGSEGRMEQVLINDQDNALVYDEDTPETRDYFRRLASHVVDNLLAAGFPPCPGGYMATNWCRSLAEWKKTVESWIRDPNPEHLMVAAIFFDCRKVGGTLDLDPLKTLMAGAAPNQLFMTHLARAALNFRPPLGLFRRIKADDGRVDLKTGGLAPVVSIARVFGLAAGTRARPTRERLEAAMEAGLISQEVGRTAIETYRYLLQLRLQEQLVVLKEGGRPDNLIQLNRLTSLEKRHLKDAFQAIGELHAAATLHFKTNALG